MAVTCIYGSYMGKRRTRNFKRQLFDSRCDENYKKKRLNLILLAEMQTTNDSNCKKDSHSIKHTDGGSLQGGSSLNHQGRGLHQTNLWRYFRRKHKNEDQKLGPDIQQESCSIQPTDKLFGSAQCINKPTSVVMKPLVNALNGLCLMD